MTAILLYGAAALVIAGIAIGVALSLFCARRDPSDCWFCGAKRGRKHSPHCRRETVTVEPFVEREARE